MESIVVQLEETETKGRAFVAEGKTIHAEMTWSKAGDALIIIDHTEVGPALKGRGVGKKLLLKIVEMVRESGIRILPLCPFAKSVFTKDTTIQDVLK